MYKDPIIIQWDPYHVIMELMKKDLLQVILQYLKSHHSKKFQGKIKTNPTTKKGAGHLAVNHCKPIF